MLTTATAQQWITFHELFWGETVEQETQSTRFLGWSVFPSDFFFFCSYRPMWKSDMLLLFSSYQDYHLALSYTLSWASNVKSPRYLHEGQPSLFQQIATESLQQCLALFWAVNLQRCTSSTETHLLSLYRTNHTHPVLILRQRLSYRWL